MTTVPTRAEKDKSSLEKLKLMGVRIPAADAWKRTVGRMKDCPVHEAAVSAGAAWREQMNQPSIHEAVATDADS
jgi:hypothetical protein